MRAKEKISKVIPCDRHAAERARPGSVPVDTHARQCKQQPLLSLVL